MMMLIYVVMYTLSLKKIHLNNLILYIYMKYKYKINYGGSSSINSSSELNNNNYSLEEMHYNLIKNILLEKNNIIESESSNEEIERILIDSLKDKNIGLYVKEKIIEFINFRKIVKNFKYILKKNISVNKINNIFIRLNELERDYFSYFNNTYKNYLSNYIYFIDEYKKVNTQQLDILITKIKDIYEHFYPDYNNNDYIIKKVLPKDSKIIYLGDYHSSVHSLMDVIIHLKEEKILNEYYELADKYYIVFLGDIVDRGPLGIECLYIIYLLFYINNNIEKNEEKIFILNGNHEEKEVYNDYGFGQEMDSQLGTIDQTKINLEELINYLPLALFIRKEDDNKWYQFCHGGIDSNQIENFHNFNKFLNDESDVFELIYEINENEKGFLWSDFAQISFFEKIIKNSDYDFTSPKLTVIYNTRPIFNNEQVKIILDKLNINCIISGHQDRTNYAFLLRDTNENFVIDENYKEHGLYTFADKVNTTLEREELNNEMILEENKQPVKIIKKENINMKLILASVMSSATISKNVPYSVYGILDLNEDRSDIIYLKQTYGI